jgi:hypothetical protein
VSRGIPNLTIDVPHQAVQKQKPLNSFWWILALGVSSNKAIESGKSLA